MSQSRFPLWENLVHALEAAQRVMKYAFEDLQNMAGPSLAALSGITIQGSTVSSDGSFSPANPTVPTPAGTQTTCSIPALSAGLITITVDVQNSTNDG
jgi:hypothetical protein